MIGTVRKLDHSMFKPDMIEGQEVVVIAAVTNGQGYVGCTVEFNKDEPDCFVVAFLNPETRKLELTVLNEGDFRALDREQAACDERDAKIREHLKRAQRSEGTRNDVLCALALLDGGRADG